mmetsp:Transcript_19407/g.62249  ORF Transcript_19407/g.62249 Transcript_19407/m.62249 type:complete len:324 (+) Transcript_19407:317-1288(+)
MPMISRNPWSARRKTMAYEEVSFPATDGCQIAAWYIPAKEKGSKKVAVVSHQSWSYANKSGMVELRMPVLPGLPGTMKQEAIDYVKLHKVLHDDGFHVLAFDMRNHGDSERRLPSGWGVVEYMDAAGALDYVNAHPVLSRCKVALFPFCVAGQAMLKANALHPEKFKNVVAMVATNLFTLKNMYLENPAFHTFFMSGGGSFQYINEETLDSALRAKHAQYIAAGTIQEDPNIDLCVKQLCATTYASKVKVPVLYCTPLEDFVPNQRVDAPEILKSFPNCEFHAIGTSAPPPFRTSTNNRSQGYNFFQNEGSEVMLDFLHRNGL